MPNYIVMHRITSEKQIVSASSIRKACKKMDWRTKDCKVKPFGRMSAKKAI